MSWGAQNRSKDAKTPNVARALSEKPQLELCGIQPYSASRLPGVRGRACAQAASASYASCRSGSIYLQLGGVAISGVASWVF
jgi:hypothetical protein